MLHMNGVWAMKFHKICRSSARLIRRGVCNMVFGGMDAPENAQKILAIHNGIIPRPHRQVLID